MTLSTFDVALQYRVVEFPNSSRLHINYQLETMYFAEIVVLSLILFLPKIKVATRKTVIYSTVKSTFPEI